MSSTFPSPELPDDMAALVPIVRRVVRARVADPHLAADLEQETFARLIDARVRLEPEALGPYAIVTAQNLAASVGRRSERERRHLHRLIDLRESPDPAEAALQDEEHEALDTALRRLPAADRELLVAHDAGGAPLADLATPRATSVGALAVRLARARAGLRVEYLLALRRVELPTDRCRAVLVSLSAGDQRRQRRLDASRHLVECPTCAALSDALVGRRRSMAALVPLFGLRRLWVWARAHPVHAAGATATTAAVAVAAVVALHPAPTPPRQPAPRPRPATILVSGHRLGADDRSVTAARGTAVEARGAVVTAVPADEGFWIRNEAGADVWVQLTGVTGESPFHVKAGDRVSFTGRLVNHPPGFAASVGLSGADESRLRAEGRHVDVDVKALRLQQP